MDFGLDKIFLTLLKEHWLLIGAVLFGLILFKLFFEDILPALVNRLKSKILFAKSTSLKDDRALLKQLTEMAPAEFENCVAEMFRNLGYKAERIGKTGDHGLDIEIEKDGKMSYVQCKKYSNSNTVGEPDVRNFLGSVTRKYVRANAYFVTTSTFTEQAKQFVIGEQIVLIDGWELVKYIRNVEKNGFAPTEERSAKICPKCGNELAVKKGKFGKFLSCGAYPECDFTKSLN